MWHKRKPPPPLLLLSSGARAGGAGETEAKESISRLERPNGRLIDLGIVIIKGFAAV